MKDSKEINLDLDVVSISKKMDLDNEALFYMRIDGDRVMLVFSGTHENLINGFATCLEKAPDMQEVFLESMGITFEDDNEED